MTKLIGYARVSTRQQSTDRQQVDILAAGVRQDDLNIDHSICARERPGPSSTELSTRSMTAKPMASMLFTIIAALGQMEHEIKREWAIDSIAKRRIAGQDLGVAPAIDHRQPNSKCPSTHRWWRDSDNGLP